MKSDPLGNVVDKHHPWNQTTTPRPQKRDFNGNYTWVMSPRWYDKRSGDHLALDTGGGPIARLWSTALSGLVDIGYIKATGNSVKINLPKAATLPETNSNGRFRSGAMRSSATARAPISRPMRRLQRCISARRPWRNCIAGRSKTWAPFKVPEEAISCGFHEAVAACFRITW